MNSKAKWLMEWQSFLLQKINKDLHEEEQHKWCVEGTATDGWKSMSRSWDFYPSECDAHPWRVTTIGWSNLKEADAAQSNSVGLLRNSRPVTLWCIYIYFFMYNNLYLHCVQLVKGKKLGIKMFLFLYFKLKNLLLRNKTLKRYIILR